MKDYLLTRLFRITTLTCRLRIFTLAFDYLRILPSAVNAVHAELARVIQKYSEKELAGAFVVVEPDRHRFRKPFL